MSDTPDDQALPPTEKMRRTIAAELNNLAPEKRAIMLQHWNSPASKLDIALLGGAVLDANTKIVAALVELSSSERNDRRNLMDAVKSLQALSDELQIVLSVTDVTEDLVAYGLNPDGGNDG